jgi:hypothetical protein
MMSASSRTLPWVPAILTVVFTAATQSLLANYATLHWPVLARHFEHFDDALRNDLGGVMGWLGIYRLCAAALALACAVWALLYRPRWVGAIALALSLYAVWTAMIIM